MSEIKTIKSKFMRNLFDQNTYVLINKNEAVIVDASAELEDVKEVLGKRKVLAILITHAHFDHTWHLEKYVNECDCDVYVCEGEEKRFIDERLNASFIVRQKIYQNVDKKFVKYYAEKLKIGSFDFDVIFTPGHTSDGVCILWNKNLFTGDTVFSDGIGRTDLEDSSAFEMKNSITKILDIDFEMAFPGHYEAADKNRIKRTIEYYL